MPQRSRAHDRNALATRALLGARSLVDRMRTLYRELEQLTGAPITLHRALLCIGEDPGIAASSLARHLGMKRPATSQILRNLAARGWIERKRSNEDQRSVRIFVTVEGRQVLKLTSGRAVGILKRAVYALDGDELAQLATGVEALLKELPGGRSAPPVARRQTTRRRTGSRAEAAAP